MENWGMVIAFAAFAVVVTALFIWWMIWMERTANREIEEYGRKLDREREEHNAKRDSMGTNQS